MFKKIIIAYDHRVNSKIISKIKETLFSSSIEYIVVGDDNEANDYPLLASRAYQLYKKEKADGMILLCGTGIGMAMVANKFDGIRAVLASTEADAYFARIHENANALVFAAGYSDENYEVKFCGRKMIRMLNVFLNTNFTYEARHQKRINQISKIEKGEC